MISADRRWVFRARPLGKAAFREAVSRPPLFRRGMPLVRDDKAELRFIYNSIENNPTLSSEKYA